MTANWKITLAILTANTVLMSASYTMLIPFLPMYLIQELGVAQGDVNWWSSAIFSVTFLISGIMAPIWGAIADKKSRKLMAIRAAACLAITYTLGGLVTTDGAFGKKVSFPLKFAVLVKYLQRAKQEIGAVLLKSHAVAAGADQVIF